MSDEDDNDTGCAAECNYVIRRETRERPEGGPIVEDVERCTGCGRVIARIPVSDSE